MKKQILKITLALSIFVLLNACVKDKFDGPDTGCLIETPSGTQISIEELKAMPVGEITTDVYIEGTVIADDESGNFYKEIIIQDTTDGISINIDRTDYYSLYPTGRNIFVNLKGLFLTSFQELAGTVDGDRILNSEIDNFLKRGKCFQTEKSDTIVLSDLGPQYVNKLVTILGVEFADACNGITYADAVTQATVNLNLTDCSSTILVRNSGFSSFAGDTVPTGNGSITGVYNVFGSDKQLFIRSTDDVNFTEARCDECSGGGSGGSGSSAYLYKDFDDNSLTSGGWTSFQESGSVNWEVGTYNSYFYGNITNYDAGTNSATEAWFISPSMDLSASTTPVLNFRNAYNFAGDPLELKVSTDFSSGNPTAATWTDLSYTASTGGFDWVDSDDVLLTAYQTANVHIAFKYTGSNSDGSNWEIDEISVDEL